MQMTGGPRSHHSTPSRCTLPITCELMHIDICCWCEGPWRQPLQCFYCGNHHPTWEEDFSFHCSGPSTFRKARRNVTLVAIYPWGKVRALYHLCINSRYTGCLGLLLTFIWLDEFNSYQIYKYIISLNSAAERLNPKSRPCGSVGGWTNLFYYNSHSKNCIFWGLLFH